MDSTIGAALIGAGGTVVAAAIPIWIAFRSTIRNQTYDRVTGSISEPRPGEIVGRTFQSSGLVTGLEPGLSIWLAIEASGFIFPRDHRISVDKDNKWTATVFEDGASKEFALSLIVTNPSADRFIVKWLEAGRRKGEYEELKGIPGSRKLARIDDLRLKG